jgi:hypothetical protein
MLKVWGGLAGWRAFPFDILQKILGKLSQPEDVLKMKYVGEAFWATADYVARQLRATERLPTFGLRFEFTKGSTSAVFVVECPEDEDKLVRLDNIALVPRLRFDAEEALEPLLMALRTVPPRLIGLQSLSTDLQPQKVLRLLPDLSDVQELLLGRVWALWEQDLGLAESNRLLEVLRQMTNLR